MPASYEVKFNPAFLNARLEAAFKASAEVAKQDAEKNRPSKTKIGVSVNVGSGHEAALVGTGLAPVFEYGRRGGYQVLPRDKQVLKFRGGKGYAAKVIGGPMRAKPFLRPASARWANVYYQRTASTFLPR